MKNRIDRMMVYEHPSKKGLIGLIKYTEFELTGELRKEYLDNTKDGHTKNKEWCIQYLASLGKLISPNIKSAIPYIVSNKKRVVYMAFWSEKDFSQPALDFAKKYFGVPDNYKYKTFESK